MIGKFTLLVSIISFFSFWDSQAQSVYTNRNTVGIQVVGSMINTSNDLSGSSYGLGLSFNRNVDLALSLSNFNGRAGYIEPYEVIGGGVGFYPIQQWKEDVITVGMFLTGSRSTLRGANGWTILVGTAATRELLITEQISLYPSAGFSYAPFVSNKGDGSSYLSLESGVSYDFSNIVKLVFSPSLNVALNSDYTAFGLTLGIVI